MSCYNYIHLETKKLVKIIKTYKIYELGNRFPIEYQYDVIDKNNNIITCAVYCIKSVDELTPEEKLEFL